MEAIKKMIQPQIIWNGIPFGPIPGPNTFLPVQHFNLSAGVKIEADKETGMSKTTGRELQECSFSIKVQAETGADPAATFAMLDALKGMSGGIYIADGIAPTLSKTLLDKIQTSDWRKLFTLETAIDTGKSLLFGQDAGGCQFMLTAVNMDTLRVDPRGTITEALITLSFTEDAAQRQTGGLRVFVNDKDVTETISVTSCFYDMHAEGEPDKIEITFADTKKQWAKWKPSAEGDTVKITDGPVNSGKLYIDTIKPENGKYKLQAYSTPKSAYSLKSRSFEGLSLPQLAKKIADENKLDLKLYSVPETKVKYAVQKGQSDLAFLHTMSKRAGVSFIVYNGALCLYSEKAIEGKDAQKTIELDLKDKFTATDDKHGTFTTCELSNGQFTGKATDSGIKTGKTHRETVTEAWANQADANAAAAARLRQLNKSGTRAEIEMSTQRELAAGSVIRLISLNWTGKAFVYRIRHDLKAKKSKIWVRKPLDY